ncbi:hypothetical protein DPMN_065339 [Dreissena polymorpha]|uniref:Uncharacterized protein n=1 Tax=Dreissena polymorpha TaxID=45954 RepID=A0A9D4CDW2_DREPO|nr:hypothetical protein DPMN_065339 [Dreissena polymorpha]
MSDVDSPKRSWKVSTLGLSLPGRSRVQVIPASKTCRPDDTPIVFDEVNFPPLVVKKEPGESSLMSSGFQSPDRLLENESACSFQSKEEVQQEVQNPTRLSENEPARSIPSQEEVQQEVCPRKEAEDMDCEEVSPQVPHW